MSILEQRRNTRDNITLPRVFKFDDESNSSDEKLGHGRGEKSKRGRRKRKDRIKQVDDPSRQVTDLSAFENEDEAKHRAELEEEERLAAKQAQDEEEAKQKEKHAEELKTKPSY